ncbi:outer membrane channel protein TolC [Tolumonas lignilytica]|jgi:type I secretion outer membrane protein, TolC family|uniref:outer membrane channel protein TolC n=1 Tax=Tolumonas lignilytica TaxID=1283284 RepID=UPI0004630BA2|nr:outer membrane channel protein TolC [Tolumonas lignilytica]
MKKSLLSVLILLGLSPWASAESLLDIYHQAQEKDPQLQETLAQRNAAFEKINESDAAKLPQINLNASTGYQKSNDNDAYTENTRGAGISLTQALFREPVWMNADITSKQAMASDVSLSLEKQNLIFRTAQAYFSVLAAQDALEYTTANEKALQRQLDETQQRFNVGMTAITDVQEAKAAHDLAVADSITAQNTLANSYEALRQLTGNEHKFLDVLNTERFSPSPMAQSADQWLKQAQDHSLALNQLRIAKDIARQQIDLAKTGHLPTLDLKLGANSNYTNYQVNSVSKQDGTVNEGTIGLQFNLPLYSGGATQSQVKQAQFNYVAASENLEKTYRSMQADLYKNYNNVFASIGTIKAYQQSVVSADSALTATQAGYQVGTRTIVDVLNATSKLYSAKQLLSNARYSYILNTIQLKQTAGVLSEQDLLDINNGLISQKK